MSRLNLSSFKQDLFHVFLASVCVVLRIAEAKGLICLLSTLRLKNGFLAGPRNASSFKISVKCAQEMRS